MVENNPQNEITQEDRIWAAVSYLLSPLSPLCILLLNDVKTRPFVRKHQIQAFVAGIFFFVIGLPIIIATLGISLLLWFVMLYWAFRSYHGESFDIPYITSFINHRGWLKNG